MIKTVFIDIDDTLLDFQQCAKICAKKSFETNGLEFNEKTLNIFLQVNNALWQQVEEQKITKEQLHFSRFNMILEKTGQKGDGHLLEKGFKDALFSCVILKEGAIDICKYLSSKYRLCTASNAPHSQQINRLTLSGIMPFISNIFTSEDLGFDKPDKSFFDACFSKLPGIKKEETIMIGDSITADIKGAKDYGLKTIWVKNKKELKDCPYADFTISQLEDIKQIL